MEKHQLQSNLGIVIEKLLEIFNESKAREFVFLVEMQDSETYKRIGVWQENILKQVIVINFRFLIILSRKTK